MKSRKKVVVGVLVVLALAVLWAGYVVWFNKDADKRTAEVVAIANQFKAPADWELVEDTVNRPTVTGCIDIVCPSAVRRYEIKPILLSDASELDAILSRSGWTQLDSAGCRENVNAVGKYSVCSATASVNDHKVSFTGIGSNNEGVVEIVITVD